LRLSKFISFNPAQLDQSKWWSNTTFFIDEGDKDENHNQKSTTKKECKQDWLV
jgi:hypothetical protein